MIKEHPYVPKIIDAALWKELNETREGRVIPELKELFEDWQFMVCGDRFIPVPINRFLTKRFMVRQ